MKRYIYVNNKKVEVEPSLYREFDNLRSQQKYSNKKFIDNTASFDDIYSNISINIENEAIRNVNIDNLYIALNHLEELDYIIIYRLYFENSSIRTLSKALNIPPMTLHYKKEKILKKLKLLMEK